MSEEKSKRELALEKKLAKLSDDKVTLEIEVESLRLEVEAWKRKHQNLSENVGRMLKKPNQLSSDDPKPKTVRGSRQISGTEEVEEALRENLGQAVVIALEKDLIKRGARMKTGTSKK